MCERTFVFKIYIGCTTLPKSEHMLRPGNCFNKERYSNLLLLDRLLEIIKLGE